MTKLIGHMLLACVGSLSSHLAVMPAAATAVTVIEQMRTFALVGEMPMRVRIAAVR